MLTVSPMGHSGCVTFEGLAEIIKDTVESFATEIVLSVDGRSVDQISGDGGAAGPLKKVAAYMSRHAPVDVMPHRIDSTCLNVLKRRALSVVVGSLIKKRRKRMRKKKHKTVMRQTRHQRRK